MKLPPQGASYHRRVLFGRYVARRLRAAGLSSLAESVQSVTAQIKAQGRAWEDHSEPVQDALADRDLADETLDNLARTVRHQLLGRSVGAEDRAPYTTIFYKGLGDYTVATLSEQAPRYGELIQRIRESVPADDLLVLDIVPQLKSAMTSWEGAVAALSSARNEASIARSQLLATTDEWNKLMNKVYGTVFAEHGKKEAEKFFPKPNSTEEAEEAEAASP